MTRRVFLLFILVTTLLWGGSSDVQLYKEILRGLFPDKETVKIFVDDAEKAKILHEIGSSIELVPRPEEADLLMLSHRTKIETKKPIFAGTYRIITAYPETVIGGFYWKKGRPTLIFYRTALQKFGLSLPEKFEKYME